MEHSGGIVSNMDFCWVLVVPESPQRVPLLTFWHAANLLRQYISANSNTKCPFLPSNCTDEGGEVRRIRKQSETSAGKPIGYWTAKVSWISAKELVQRRYLEIHSALNSEHAEKRIRSLNSEHTLKSEYSLTSLPIPWVCSSTHIRSLAHIRFLAHVRYLAHYVFQAIFFEQALSRLFRIPSLFSNL